MHIGQTSVRRIYDPHMRSDRLSVSVAGPLQKGSLHRLSGSVKHPLFHSEVILKLKLYKVQRELRS